MNLKLDQWKFSSLRNRQKSDGEKKNNIALETYGPNFFKSNIYVLQVPKRKRMVEKKKFF